MEIKPATCNVKAILFDNDGSMADTHDLILASFRHTMETVFGEVPPDDVLLKKVGQTLTVQMRDFETENISAEELCEIYREHNHRIHDELIRPFPGIAETLAELQRRGYRMGLVTSKRRELAAHGLEILGILQYMDCIVGGYDLPVCKPDPAPIVLGAEKLDLTPEQCAYVGDSPYDMEGGRRAGCPTVACLWGMFPEEALLAEHPDFVCAKPEDLLTVFP